MAPTAKDAKYTPQLAWTFWRTEKTLASATVHQTTTPWSSNVYLSEYINYINPSPMEDCILTYLTFKFEVTGMTKTEINYTCNSVHKNFATHSKNLHHKIQCEYNLSTQLAANYAVTSLLEKGRKETA